MVLMTKFDKSSFANWWLRFLKEKLASEQSSGTWLKQADACIKSHAALWAEQTLEFVWILANKNLEKVIVENKNIFIQLLIQEFPSDSCDIITDIKASAQRLSLRLKVDKDLYIYYCQTESLLKEIHGQNKVTNNSRNIIVLSSSRWKLLKNTIMKLILEIWNLNLQFCVIKY